MQETRNKFTTTNFLILFYFFGIIILFMTFRHFLFNLHLDFIIHMYKNKILYTLFYWYNKFILNLKLFNILDGVYYFDITNDRNIFFDKLNFFIQNLNNFYEYYFNFNIFLVTGRFSLEFNSTLEYIRFIFILILILFSLVSLSIVFFNILVSYGLFFCFLLFCLVFLIYSNNFTFFYKLNYINFLIDESFLNRNLYIDSNYFLTNDSMRGIEKFSDITSPWLIDFEDFGWGGEFSIQTISKQIVERERRLILENMYIDNSPNMENLELKPGTLKTRLIKLYRRFEVFAFYLNSYMGERHKIKNIWKREHFFKRDSLFLKANVSSLDLNKPVKAKFFTNTTSNLSPILYDNRKFPKLSFKKIMREHIRKLGYTFRMDNDFFLSKKNNITNDVQRSGSNIKNRKEVVFRNVINQLDTVKNKNGIDSRIPDVSLDSNYIFERQLHEGRILDYELKRYLLSYFKNRFSFYFQNKIFFDTNFKKTIAKYRPTNYSSYNMEGSRLFFNLDVPVEKQLSGAFISNLTKKYKSNKLKLDERLENFTKILTSELSLHYNYDLEDSEFPYLKNETREICGFLDKFGFMDEVLVYLLEEKKLKLGLYTYSNFEKKPWEFTNQSISDIWKLRFVDKKYNKNFSKLQYTDNFKKIPKYYDYIHSKFSALNSFEKKTIYIKTLSQTKPSWFYFNKIHNDFKFIQFFNFTKNEYAVNNFVGSEGNFDKYIFNFWNSSNYAYLSMYYNNFSILKKFDYFYNNKSILKKTGLPSTTYSKNFNFIDIFSLFSKNNLHYLYLFMRKNTKSWQPFYMRSYPWDFEHGVGFNWELHYLYTYKKHYRLSYNFYIITPLESYGLVSTFNLPKKINANLLNFIFFIKKHLRTNLEFFDTVLDQKKNRYFYYDSFKDFCIKFFTIKNIFSTKFLFNFYYWILFYTYKVKIFVYLNFLLPVTIFFEVFIYFYPKIYLYCITNLKISNFIYFFKNKYYCLNLFLSRINNIGFFLFLKTIFFNFYFNFFLNFFYYKIEFSIIFYEYAHILANFYYLVSNIFVYFLCSSFVILNKINIYSIKEVSKFLYFIFLKYFDIFSNAVYSSITNFIFNYTNVVYYIFYNFFNFLFLVNFTFFFNFYVNIFNFSISFGFLEVIAQNMLLFADLEIVINRLFVKFINFSLYFDNYFFYFIFVYGERLNTVFYNTYVFFNYYLDIYTLFGFSKLIDQISAELLKEINIFYASKFTRVVVYWGGYYDNITMDINDILLKRFSLYFKNFIFFWININLRFLNYKSKIDAFVDFRVLENFKTYLRLVIKFKIKYSNFLHFLDIFIFQSVSKFLILCLLELYFYFVDITFFIFNKLCNFFTLFTPKKNSIIFKVFNLLLYFFNIYIKQLSDFYFLFFDMVFNFKLLGIVSPVYAHVDYSLRFHINNKFKIEYFFLYFLDNMFQNFECFLDKNTLYILKFIHFFNIFFSDFSFYFYFISIDQVFGKIIYLILLFFKFEIVTFYFYVCNFFFSYFFFYIFNTFYLYLFFYIKYTIYSFVNIFSPLIHFDFYTFFKNLANTFFYYHYIFIFLFINEVNLFRITKLHDNYSYLIFLKNKYNLYFIFILKYFSFIQFKFFLFKFWFDDTYVYNLSVIAKKKEIKFKMCYYYWIIYLEYLYMDLFLELDFIEDYLIDFMWSKFDSFVYYISNIFYLVLLYFYTFSLTFFYLQDSEIYHYYYYWLFKNPKILYNIKKKKLLTLLDFNLKKKNMKYGYLRLFSLGRGRLLWKYKVKNFWNFNNFYSLHLLRYRYSFNFSKRYARLHTKKITNFLCFTYLNFMRFSRNTINKHFFFNSKYYIKNFISLQSLNFIFFNIFYFSKNTKITDYPSIVFFNVNFDFFKLNILRDIRNLVLFKSNSLIGILLFLEYSVRCRYWPKQLSDISIKNQILLNLDLIFLNKTSNRFINLHVNDIFKIYNLSKNKSRGYIFFYTALKKDFIFNYFFFKDWLLKNYVQILSNGLTLKWSQFTFWRYSNFENILFRFSDFFSYKKTKSILFFIPNFDKFTNSDKQGLNISQKSFDFLLNDLGRSLVLNFLGIDNIFNKNTLNLTSYYNKDSYKFSDDIFFEGIADRPDFHKKDKKHDFDKNYFKLDKNTQYFKLNFFFLKDSFDFFNVKFFYNFFKKIENYDIFIKSTKKIKNKYPYFGLVFIENLNINNLGEVSSQIVNFYIFFIVFFNNLVLFFDKLFKFCYILCFNFFISYWDYYTYFDKKSIYNRFYYFFIKKTHTVPKPVYSFGSIWDNRLYRFFLYKIVYSKPILLDKVNVDLFKNLFNFNYRQEFTLISYFLIFLDKFLLYTYRLIFNDIFWLTQINLFIIIYSYFIFLDCCYLQLLTNFYIKLFEYLAEIRLNFFFILYSTGNFEILKNIRNTFLFFIYFFDILLYTDLFLEDLLKFQLICNNRLFHFIVKYRDVQIPIKKNNNHLGFEYINPFYRYRILDKYLIDYIRFIRKYNSELGDNVFFFFKLFNFLCVYSSNYFKFLNLFFLNWFYDLKSDYLEFNSIFYKKYIDLAFELLETYDELIRCWWEYLIQDLSQRVWLELTIYFDIIFEYLIEVDYELEENPFSIFLEEFFNVIVSFLRGSPFYEIDISSFDLSEWSSLKATSFENDNFHGFSDIDVDDSLGFLGWGFNDSLGSNPGNEFSTLNDISEIPEFLEKALLFDINDFYNNIFGLDNPQLGTLQPSFDISLPLKSLWVLGAIYYDPYWGGAAIIDFNALFSFLKILYIDRRTFNLNNLFILVDYTIYNDNLPGLLFLKFKIIYFYYDWLQLFDSIYFSIFDILHFWLFYLIYIFEILGIFVIISTFALFLIFLKLNNISEKKERIFSRNTSTFYLIFYNFLNYSFFRYIYLALSNMILFLKMSISILIVLTFTYVFSEGLHILSVLRIFDVSQESLLFLNGQYFLLERDPFVEKHNPIDEMVDQFKYESGIDDEWSRIHYSRETAEILGGPDKEQGSVIDNLGFTKKFNIAYDIDDSLDELDTTPSMDSRYIVDQIHNNFVDEYTFMPNFYQNSILEREFFRESEMYEEEVEGSLDFLNRSENRIDHLWFDFQFEDMHDEQNLQGSLEFDEDVDLWDNDLYGALILNLADPKWLYTASPSLTAKELTPHIIGNNQSQLYSTGINRNFHFYDKIYTKNIAYNRVANLLNRNKGKVDYSPILDFFDEDEFTDWGLDINDEYGTSIGSTSNLLDIWDDHTADPVTQLAKHSNSPAITDSILFNYTSTDELLPPNYYSGEDLIFENFFDTVFNTKFYGFENYTTSDAVDDAYDDEAYWEEFDSDSYDNFFPKIGRFGILEDNYKNKNFVGDYMPEGYFNLTSYVFRDLNKNTRTIVKDGSYSSLNLENIRKRDLIFKKLEGTSPLNIFYDEMISDDLDKLIYYNLENANANWGNSSFYKKNEFSQKMDLTQKNIWWTPSGNEYRALYFDEFQYGSKNPYAEHINENDYDLVDFLRSENQEEWFVPEIFHDRVSQLKSVMKKRKWKPQRDLTNKFSTAYTKIKPNWYFNKKNNNKNLIKKQSHIFKFLILSKLFDGKKHFSYFNETNPKEYNSLKSELGLKFSELSKTTPNFAKFLNILTKTNKDRVGIFINKKVLSAVDLGYNDPSNTETDDIYGIKKIFDKSHEVLLEKKDKQITLLDFLEIKKLKPNLTNFLKNKFITQNLDNLVKPTNFIIQSEILSDDDFSGEMYNSKLEQYLSSFEYSPKLTDVEDEADSYFEDTTDFIFFNNKWSIDNIGKLHYNLYDNFDIFSLNESFTKLKNSKGLLKNSIELLNKNLTESAKVRKFAATPDRGYWSEFKDEIAQDERLTGILNPKIIENPIFLNDSEAFKEFSEIWNIDFGRRDNNLEILGMGQPREMALFDLYSNGPDYSPIRREIPIYVDRSDFNSEDSEFYGIDESNYEVEDRLRAGESWYGFNFDIGKNWYKYRLANFSKLIETELLSENYNSKINWFDFEKFGLTQKSKNFKMPWALDITNKFNFSGSQNWNFQKNDENLIKLITNGNFKIFNNDIAAADEFAKQKLNLSNIKKNIYFSEKLSTNKPNLYLSFDNNVSENSILLNNYSSDFRLFTEPELKDSNFSGLDVDLDFNNKVKFLENIKDRENNFNDNNSSDFEMLQDSINTTTYSIDYDPDEFATNIDRNWDVDLKFDYATRFYQYGKMYRSLNQNNLILDHFKSNIALDNIAITPDQSSDYFWYTYKKYKNNKFDNFFKKINYSRDVPTQNKILKLNFENFIKSPIIANNKSTSTLEEFNNLTEDLLFPNLPDSWESGFMDLKLNYRPTDDTIPTKDYELFDIDDFDYQNLNSNNFWTFRNKKIKNVLKRYPDKFLSNELFIKKDKTDMNTIYHFVEDTNDAMVSNNIWWSMDVNSKFKNIKQSKESYLYDNLFGLYIQKFKKKNNVLRERNAQIKQKQINNLLFNGIKFSDINYNFSKFWLKFSKNENLINAMTNLIKIKNIQILGDIVEDSQEFNNDDIEYSGVEKNINLFNSELDFESTLENLPYLLGSPQNTQTLIKNFNIQNSNIQDLSDFYETIFNDDPEFSELSTNSEYSNRHQMLSTYLKNKKYKNILNSDNFKKNNLFSISNIENNLQEVDDFSEINSISLEYNMLNENFSNFNRWAFSLENNIYNTGNFFNSNVLGNSWISDTPVSSNYNSLESTSKINTNSDTSGENDFEDIPMGEEFGNLDDSILDSGLDIHYFNNKKINTLKNMDIAFTNQGIIRPVLPTNNSLSASEVIADGLTNSLSSFSEFDEEILESEDSNIFQNIIYYNNTFPKTKIYAEIRFPKINTVFKKNIFNNFLNSDKDLTFLHKPKKIVSNELELSLQNNNYYLDNILVTKKQNNKLPLEKFKWSFNIGGNAKFFKNKKINNSLDNYMASNFSDDSSDIFFNKEKINTNKLSTWRNKNKIPLFGEHLEFSSGSEDSLNLIKKLNKNNFGLKNSINFITNNVYLDKNSKIDVIFGNSRFFNFEDNTFDFSRNSKNLSKNKFKNLNNKQLVKSDNFGYLRNELHTKNYTKNINNFYSNYFSNSLNSDLDYLRDISIPIIKNISFSENIQNNQYFIFNDTDTNVNDFKNTEIDFVEHRNFDTFLKWNNNRKLGSTLKTSYQYINEKNEKTTNLFRNFSYSESIYPLPIVKSLSVSSNLFNKINSLRLYGSGRLGDYFYNTKLKHLLGSNKQNIDFDDDDDINYDDDLFLLDFDEEEENDYWYQDLDSEDILLDEDDADFTTKIISSTGIKEDNVLENYDDCDDFFINFSNENKYDSDEEDSYRTFVDLLEELDEYDSIEDRELEIETDYGGKNTNLLENLKWNSLQYLLNQNNTTVNFNLYKDSIINNSITFENLGIDSQFSDFLDSDDLEEFNVNFNIVDNINLRKIPISKGASNFRFYNNSESSFDDLIVTTFEDLLDDCNDFQLTDNLEYSDFNNTNSLEDISNNFENIQDIVQISNKQNIYNLAQFSGNVNSNVLTGPLNINTGLSFSDQFNILDSEDLDLSVFSNSTVYEDLGDDFNDNIEEFEDITNFMSKRFLFYEVPSEKLDSLDNGLNFVGKFHTNLSNDFLIQRKNNYFYKNIYNFSKKKLNKHKLFTNYSLPKNSEFDLKSTTFVNLNQNTLESNWFLNKTYWSEIIDDFEDFDISSYLSFDNFEEDSEGEYSSFEKIKNSDDLENSEILFSISDYLLNNKLFLSDNNLGDIFDKNTAISNMNQDFIENNEQMFNLDPDEVLSSWNIHNIPNSSFNWEEKKNKNINLKNFYEKNSNLHLKELLSRFSSDYIIKGGALNVKNENKTSLQNLGIFLRKANSRNSGIFGIKKFINLKKKYWNRLDIVEKYTTSLKNKIIKMNKNSTDTLLKNQLTEKTISNKKPLHSDISNFIKFLYNTKYRKYSEDTFNIDDGSALENLEYIYSLDFNKNIDIDFLNFDGSVKLPVNFFNSDSLNFNFEKKWNNFSLFSDSKLSDIFKKMYKLENFYDKFSIDYINTLDTQDPINDETFLNENSDYLSFKLENLKKKTEFDTGLDEIFDDSYEIFDISDADLEDEEEDDIFDIYSKLRNDLQKLESNKYGNNYLTPSISSTLLSSLAGFSLQNYLKEIPKNTNFYKNIKNFNNIGIFPNNSFESFLDKESKRSVKRLNNIDYFRKSPVIDQFTIYHKKLTRPGLDLGNMYATLPLDPFRKFTNNSELYDRSIKYGSGDYIFKNSPVSRRSYDLAMRTFGPDIITNSTLLGYGRFDFISDLNQDDEEDSGINDNIGYPVINEQNLYNYDYPDIVDTYTTDSIFSIDFLDFMWDIDDESSYFSNNFYEGYEPFFELTDNYERLPLFSIFLPKRINIKKQEFDPFNIKTWSTLINPLEVILPDNSTFFNLNVADIEDNVDFLDSDGDEEVDDDSEDGTDSGDFEPGDFDDNGEYMPDNDVVDTFYKDLGSLSFFDFTPLGFLPVLKWLDYYEGEAVDNASLDDEDEKDEDLVGDMSPLTFIYSILVDPDENDIVDEDNLPKGFIEPAFNSRYFQTWNTSQSHYFEPAPEIEDLDAENMDDDIIDVYADTVNYDLTEEEDEGARQSVVYRFPFKRSTPYDIISRLRTETEMEWHLPEYTWADPYEKKFKPRKSETDLTGKIYTDDWNHNIGPLGFEEGDTIFENRMLNRGWYPEKIVWNWGIRDQSRIGNDLTTLELLSDYATSFSHGEEHFGNDPDDEALLSLSWAGKNNKLFNLIDDIVEGIGIEEDIPFSPETARKLWEYEEHEERHTYEENVFADSWYFNEDDDEDYYTNYNDPQTFYHYKDDLFNTLGYLRFESESDSWEKTNYLGNLDATILSGSSMALANNVFYDGLMTDFSNFIYEKFPIDPKNNIVGMHLPYTTESLFTVGEFEDSPVPGFSDYLIDINDEDEEDDEEDDDEEDSIEKDENFNLLETFKPKDSFNFSPDDSGFLTFEPEWVVNGEGWLGNTGSTLKIFDKENLNDKYLNPELEYFSAPKGIHSFEVLDDEDASLGIHAAYFSLSDFQKNRIIRGRDNDIANFPIKSGWNLTTGFAPEWHNLFWKHRVRYGDSDESLLFDLEEFEYQITNSESPSKTGIGIPFTDTLLDNPDFITFNEIEINQRNLWWKSISGGYLNDRAKLELGVNSVLNNSESYRDFLLSYDYRIFGKSWLNPQNTEIPLKSFNFYGDSQINSWLANNNDSDSNAYSDLDNNYSIFDYTYGYFVNSQTNFDSNLTYYSVHLRNFLYKIQTLAVVYFSYVIYNISSFSKVIAYYFFDFIFYKVGLLYVLIQYFTCVSFVYNYPLGKIIAGFVKFLQVLIFIFIHIFLFFELFFINLINISVFDLYSTAVELFFYIKFISKSLKTMVHSITFLQLEVSSFIFCLYFFLYLVIIFI